MKLVSTGNALHIVSNDVLKKKVLNSHDLLPSDLVAQSVEQR